MMTAPKTRIALVALRGGGQRQQVLHLIPDDQQRTDVREDDVATCGHCGRAWDDEQSTWLTPVPSGRCPFEYQHEYAGPGELVRCEPVRPPLWELQDGSGIPCGEATTAEEVGEFVITMALAGLDHHVVPLWTPRCTCGAGSATCKRSCPSLNERSTS